MTKVQCWNELLAQCEQATKDAPQELVEAFEDAINRGAATISSSSSTAALPFPVDHQQLRADFNKIAAEWRRQLDDFVNDQQQRDVARDNAMVKALQEREAKKEKDQRELEAKRDKSIGDEVSRQVAQVLDTMKKEMLEQIRQVLGLSQDGITGRYWRQNRHPW